MMRKKTVSIFLNIILVLGSIILLFFFWLSLISTSTVTLMEHVYFTGIKGLKAFLICICLVVLLSLSFMQKITQKAEIFLTENPLFYRIVLYSLYIALAIVSITWVCSTRFNSWSDSLSIQQAAANLINGIYEDFYPGGYIDAYCNQIGITLIISLLMKISGVHDGLLFQVINAICVPLIYIALSHYVSSGVYKLLFPVFGIIWYPLIFSASHVYGNIPGLALALWAFIFYTSYLKKERKTDAVISVLLIALACIVKQNYLIFLIAYVLKSVYDSIRLKRINIIVLGVASLVIAFMSIRVTTVLAEKIVGTGNMSGISPWAYIAMGMQDSNRAPGWFNEFNRSSYITSGFDASIQKDMAFESIKSRIAEFEDHPAYALDFYVKKIASQWNESTLQSIWILRGHDGVLTKLANYLISIRGALDQINYLKFFQLFIYLFSLIELLFGLKEDDPMCILIIAFLGGVLFHLIWEAKAQYSLPYICILIPVAFNGFERLTQILGELFSPNKEHIKLEKTVLMRTLVSCVVFALVAIILYSKHIPQGLTADTYTYYQWIVDNIDY